MVKLSSTLLLAFMSLVSVTPHNENRLGLEFNGDDYVEVAYSPSLTLTTHHQWTLSAKIRWDGAAEVAPYQAVLSQPTTVSNTGVALVVSSGKLVGAFNSAVTNTGVESPSDTIVTGVWTHIAFTYDGAYLRIYKNGIEVGDLSMPGLQGDDSDQPFFIGIEGLGETLKDRPFHGAVAEAAVWNFARTQPEILEDMNAGLSRKEPNLLAYYAFNDGPKNYPKLTDMTVQGNHGVIHGATWTAPIPKSAKNKSSNTKVKSAKSEGGNS
jgi:hypothetical protein